MKKKIILFIPVILLIVFIKYFTGNYSIKYKRNGYNVLESFKSKQAHFVLSNGQATYDYMYISPRKFNKKIVSKVEEKEVNGYICVTPIIKGFKKKTLCYKDGEIVSLEIALEEEIDYVAKNDFEYNTLTKDEYILIWKYDGFYYLNKDEYKTINLFNTNRYSNDLMYQIDAYLIFPKYDNNYLFSSFYVLDMTSGKYTEISTNYSINYDSYITGNHKNSIFLFDNKNENLYEINYKNKKVSLIGSEIKGFIKYENKKKKEALKEDYTINKITYFESNEKPIIAVNNTFIYDNGYKFKYNQEEVLPINNINDTVYFIYKDNIYKYDEGITTFIAHYFELNFNNNNNVFVYKK